MTKDYRIKITEDDENVFEVKGRKLKKLLDEVELKFR